MRPDSRLDRRRTLPGDYLEIRRSGAGTILVLLAAGLEDYSGNRDSELPSA